MFNSLKYAKNLEEAGVPRQQAEAHVLLISEFLEMNLATKQDMLVSRQDTLLLSQDIALLKQDLVLLEQKIVQSEQRMTIKLGTIVTVAIGVAVALAKLVS